MRRDRTRTARARGASRSYPSHAADPSQQWPRRAVILLLLGGISAAPATETVPFVPIDGAFAELAVFTVDVFVGSPPQRLSLIADTGSSSTSFPCGDVCLGSACAPHRHVFNASASASVALAPCSAASHCGSCFSAGDCGAAMPSAALRRACGSGLCAYRKSYAEGSSVDGVYILDELSLRRDSRAPRVRAQLGCHTRESGLLRTQSGAGDGVLGLSAHSIGLLRALHSGGLLRGGAFSLCLSPSGGGTLLLGDSGAPRNFRGSGSGEGGAASAREGGESAALHAPASSEGRRGGTRLTISDAGWYMVALAGISVSLPAATSDGARSDALEPRWIPLVFPDEAREGKERAGGSAGTAHEGNLAGSSLEAVVDTGSSFTYLPRAAVARVVAAIAALCAPDAARGASVRCGYRAPAVRRTALLTGQSACFLFDGALPDDAASARMPLLSLVFADGGRLTLDARSYLAPLRWTAPYRCLGLYASDGSSSAARGRAILGVNALLFHRVEFSGVFAGAAAAAAAAPPPQPSPLLRWEPADCAAERQAREQEMEEAAREQERSQGGAGAAAAGSVADLAARSRFVRAALRASGHGGELAPGELAPSEALEEDALSLPSRARVSPTARESLFLALLPAAAIALAACCTYQQGRRLFRRTLARCPLCCCAYPLGLPRVVSSTPPNATVPRPPLFLRL